MLEGASRDTTRRLLVVEDDADICETVADLLADEGFEVRIARDGHDSDAVLGGDGFGAFREVPFDARRQDEVDAFGGEPVSNGETDAVTAPGDERDFSAEPEIHRAFLLQGPRGVKQVHARDPHGRRICVVVRPASIRLAIRRRR